MQPIITRPIKFFALLIFGALLFVSCKDDSIDPNSDPNSQYTGINNWVYAVMADLYYWNDQLPKKPATNQEPSNFFGALQNKDDRFSVIVPDYKKLINSLNGINLEAGYEYLLTRESGSEDGVLAIILYVKKNSPASYAGLKRGDEITRLNGTRLSMSNYKSLMGQTAEPHSIFYRRFDDEVGSYTEGVEVGLNTIELAENPSHLDTVISIGGRKIGYFVYNFFSPGEGAKYDKEVEQIFGDFKNQGVNELVLDLRYNSGGAISSATTLGSLIARGVSSSNVFYENRWNSKYQNYWEGQKDGEQHLKGKFKDFSANIGSNLPGKIYVIVGDRTASASELLINGLKPYMDVYLIGEKTVGKNVGSVAIDDEANPNNPYGLLPIVLKVHNSEGFSDYADGFEPDALIEEFRALPLKPLGDIEEPLFARAIQEITGIIAARDKEEAGSRRTAVETLQSSLDLKAHTNRLIYDFK